MLYAPDATELLAVPKKLAIYTPEQQSRLRDTNRNISAECLMDELFGLRLLDGSRLVAVPYLQQLVQHVLPHTPDLEMAAAFARTSTAETAIKQTLDMFSLHREAYAIKKPAGVFTIAHAASVLHVGRNKARSLIDQAGLELSDPASSRYYGSTTMQFATENLERLYEWQYPANFPIKYPGADIA